jgi:nucleoside-diphosphate-sugar epimerase
MEPYFSKSTDRRVAWQGHETKANVRNVIRCARRAGRDLKVYASGADADGWATYTLIPAEQWDAYFAEDAAPVVFAPAKATAHQFVAWPKTMRHFRDIVVTEKIDGTNAGIHIDAVSDDTAEWAQYPADSYTLVVDGTRYMLTAQSRNRLIYPGKTTDNYGFASWVYDHAEQLVRVLGAGLHFGEWWGRGIGRNYGMTGRRFSLFDTHKYAKLGAHLVGRVWMEAVPVLYQGPHDTTEIKRVLHSLNNFGSVVVAGWGKPEGICVYHSATRKTTKVTLDNNDAGKWEVA